MIYSTQMLASALYWVRQSRRATVLMWAVFLTTSVAMTAIFVRTETPTLGWIIASIVYGVLTASLPSAFVLACVGGAVADKAKAAQDQR